MLPALSKVYKYWNFAKETSKHSNSRALRNVVFARVVSWNVTFQLESKKFKYCKTIKTHTLRHTVNSRSLWQTSTHVKTKEPKYLCLRCSERLAATTSKQTFRLNVLWKVFLNHLRLILPFSDKSNLNITSFRRFSTQWRKLIKLRNS